MFGSIYTALAGMNAFSQGLNVVSNNVANMNTPGFKSSDPLFREIVYRQIASAEGNGGGLRPQGAGVEADAAGLSFAQGELRDTGNDLDIAIDGSGFLVLEQDGGRQYTRAGQLTFNDDGILVERSSGATVLMTTPEHAAGAFDLNPVRSYPPKATTTISLSGTLARTSTSATYEMSSGLTAYDASGASIPLRAKFVRDDTDNHKWTVQILGAANTVLGTGTIQFNEDGTPAQDASSVAIDVSTEDIAPFTVTFDFGAPGTYAGVTSSASSTTSQLQPLKNDGLQLGSLTSTKFDEHGQLQLVYSNGHTETVGQLVLADFDNPEQLQALNGGMFVAKEGTNVRLSSAMTDGTGRVVGGKLEMSNVVLTQQFTDLIILQRGYQASSQVSSIANELIQTLLSMDGRQ